MSSLDLLARAEVSSDLRHHDRPCDVDILGAAGMAAYSNPTHTALFRLKYLNDLAEIGPAKALFITWARKAMINRKISPAGANRLGVQALMAWLADVCGTCDGRKRQAIDGTPTLSDAVCPACKGTGRARIREHGALAEVIRDLHDRADAAVRVIQGGVSEKLGRENTC